MARVIKWITIWEAGQNQRVLPIPYPIQVYAPDGTSVLVNQGLLKEYNVSSPDMIVGKYNVFEVNRPPKVGPKI